MDRERDIKEDFRENILSEPRSIAQALELSSEDEAVHEFEQSLTQTEREDINERLELAREKCEAFKQQYGHEAWENIP